MLCRYFQRYVNEAGFVVITIFSKRSRYNDYSCLNPRETGLYININSDTHDIAVIGQH